MTEPIVIVGGGVAAGNAVIELRENGYDGDLIVYADEPHPPYERPPLSKGYLVGNSEVEGTYVRPLDWYSENNVDLRIANPVTSIDVAAKAIHTAQGTEAFSRLLIATGAYARRLPELDGSNESVGYLRNIADSQRLRDRLVPGSRLLIVGGGWIGMEVAATSRQRGVDVTIVEPELLPLLRVLGTDVAQALTQVHQRNGVDVRTSTSVTSLRDGHAVLSDGSELSVDTVLIGIGAIPNDAIARAAGLEIDNGIVVNASLQTSHPDIYAAGDVANHAHPTLHEKVRVEHWQNAVNQGKVAAQAMLGADVVYDDIPSFFSDQYSLGMEYFGYPGAGGTNSVNVQRPSTSDDPDALTAWWYRDDRLVAAMHINQWDRSDELKDRVRGSSRGLLDG